jgi:hypothetical protein
MTMSLKQLSVLLVFEDHLTDATTVSKETYYSVKRDLLSVFEDHLTQDASERSERDINQDAGEGGSGEGKGARSDRSGGTQRLALRVSTLAEATGLPLSQVYR